MARKPTAPPARRAVPHSTQTLRRIADLAARGASPMRVRREVEDMVVVWLAAAADPDEAQEQIASARDQLQEGIEAGREALDEAEGEAALAAGKRALAALEAARDALAQAPVR